MDKMNDNYDIYEVKLIEIPLGRETTVCVTNSKEKAKLFAVKLFAEHYAFIMGKLKRVEVYDNSIETEQWSEYWYSQLVDHQDIEHNALKLLHNARCSNHVQNTYLILSSDTLLNI